MSHHAREEPSVRDANKSKPYIPALSKGTDDGFSNEDEATATCFCGAVQLVFGFKGLIPEGNFLCHCTDCHKIHSSMFATNFCCMDKYVRYTRGRENLTEFSTTKTPVSGKAMVNHFCKTCGTLMNRTGEGFPGINVLRVGTVDDFNLMETKLKPQVQQFTKDRVSWLEDVPGVKKVEGFHYWHKVSNL
ncbi:Mss4-like protein [Lophiotrema nucula]|uniref:Mss4-like protein n=1 Tax=Lophiotrema nucula TaxID=690887 RepID=A0A6A5Z760_9PLEO|nr:Mss4-like protein [Lophiotrema nucula]